MPPKKAKKPKGSEEKSIETSTPVENPDHPEDIFPILLTSATQELFECRADEDVTGEKPYKLLKKDDMVQDIKRRAAVSDFSPVKQIVLDYPEDEFLLVFDRDFTYGQSFYLVLTPEAKDRILAPPEPEVTEVVEEEVKKSPEPKEWISLGSEQEIDEESVKETRDRLRYKFSRVRRNFGASVVLSDRSTADAKDSYLECASYPDSKFSIKQLQRDCGIQAVPRLQSSSVQTQWKFKKNIITQYEAIEFNEEEKASVLQADKLKNFLNLVTPRVLKALQQEQIANVFTDDWKDLATGAEADDWSGKVSEGLTLYQAFTDQKYSKDKIVSSINWHPTIYGIIAVALIENKEKQTDESIMMDFRTSFIVFYSFSDPSHPQLLLECPDEIFAFEFCPSDPNIIIGGCMNGQVVLWDIFKHFTHLQETHPGGKKASDAFDLDVNENNKTPVMRYTAVSTLESSHKARITDVKWLPRTFEVTKTGAPMGNKNNFSVQFITCSPDCSILFWDVRVQKSTHSSSDTRHNVAQKNQLTAYTVTDRFKHLDRSWKPLFRIALSKLNATGLYAPLKIDFEPYTCSSTDKSTEEAGGHEHSSEVAPDYTQLIVHSAGSLTPLADVNTKLYIGTEDGEVVYTDWKLEKEDAGNLQNAKPIYCYNSHHWMVNTVQRSPFLKDIILTTGGWNFTIWREGLKTGPLVRPRNSEQECTVGCWSLSRPAVFFIGKSDGSLEVWNLLKKTSEPVQSHSHVASARITCITPWIASPKQHFLAVTDSLGMVRIFEIPKKLYTPARNESLNVRKYLELGEEGLRDYFKREELWAKEKKELDEQKRNMTADKPVKTQRDIEDTAKKEYDEYLTQEESILKAMGLNPAIPQNM